MNANDLGKMGKRKIENATKKAKGIKVDADHEDEPWKKRFESRASGSKKVLVDLGEDDG